MFGGGDGEQARLLEALALDARRHDRRDHRRARVRDRGVVGHPVGVDDGLDHAVQRRRDADGRDPHRGSVGCPGAPRDCRVDTGRDGRDRALRRRAEQLGEPSALHVTLPVQQRRGHCARRDSAAALDEQARDDHALHRVVRHRCGAQAAGDQLVGGRITEIRR